VHLDRLRPGREREVPADPEPRPRRRG
jgi:hypothetical protein